MFPISDVNLDSAVAAITRNPQSERITKQSDQTGTQKSNGTDVFVHVMKIERELTYSPPDDYIGPETKNKYAESALPPPPGAISVTDKEKKALIATALGKQSAVESEEAKMAAERIKESIDRLAKDNSRRRETIEKAAALWFSQLAEGKVDPTGFINLLQDLSADVSIDNTPPKLS